MRLKTAGKGGVLAGAVALAISMLVPLESNIGVYTDIAGVLTDCYGNTKNVSRQWKRSEAECKALLNGEAERIGSIIIKKVPNIPKGVLASTISWQYNVGDHAGATSTLLKFLRAGDWDGACAQLHRWVYITDPKTKRKVKVKGLQNRRDVEYKVCMDLSLR